jgi:hypothetical protein
MIRVAVESALRVDRPVSGAGAVGGRGLGDPSVLCEAQQRRPGRLAADPGQQGQAAGVGLHEALRACRARKLSTSRMRRSAGPPPRVQRPAAASARAARRGRARPSRRRGGRTWIVPDLAVTRGDVAHGLVPLSAEHGGLLASGRAARPRVATRLRTCSRPGSVSTRAATSACRHLAAAAPIRTRQSVAEASMGVSRRAAELLAGSCRRGPARCRRPWESRGSGERGSMGRAGSVSSTRPATRLTRARTCAAVAGGRAARPGRR